jgi:type III pantothenate kinase
MNAHILAIDAGNTRIKWGLHDGAAWSLRGAVGTADIADSGTFRDGLKASVVDRIVISNVAGSAVGKVIEDKIHFLDTPMTFIAARASQCGVVNGYDAPAQLGSDRWAALVAARAAALDAPHPQLVVMSGTALTVDALTADGFFLGGIIVPGLSLMRRALNSGTAQLPAIPGQYQTFPGSTIDAITSGALDACAGAVQRMFAHLSDKTGDVPRCMGSGGAIDVLAQHLPFPVSINDNLVLDGLLVIAEAS